MVDWMVDWMQVKRAQPRFEELQRLLTVQDETQVGCRAEFGGAPRLRR